MVLAGFFYARIRTPNLDSANALNIDVFVPFLILAVFTGQSIQVGEYKTLMLAIALITVLPGVLMWPLCRVLKIHWKTLLPPMMFKNSGNLGIPLLLLAFGEKALPAILILFIVENTLHFSVGMWMLKPSTRNASFLKQPMLIATITGLVLAYFEINVPVWLVTGFELLGDIAVPLMLVALGVRLVSLDMSGWRLGLFGTLASPLSGLIIAWPVLGWLDLPAEQEKMAWIFAALPPAVLNYLVAERFKQEPDKVASIVMFSNAGAIFIIPLVLYLVL